MNASSDAASRPGTPAVLGLLVGLVYLWWRFSTIGSGTTLALSIPLLVIEAWAFVQLAFLAIQTWRLPPPTPRGSSGGEPDEVVDIAIVAAGLEADDLERTLIASRAVRGRGPLVVIDDHRRYRHRSLAGDHGASYHIDRRAAEVPGLAAYRNTTSDRYLWLTAGQLPMPDVLEVTAARFRRTDLAVCQVATSLLNRDDLAHLGRAGDDETLVNQVLGPGMSRSDAGPWLGSASMVRRAAIEAVGGFDRQVPIERLAARLNRAGWATAFEGRRLVATTAPEAIDRYLARRRNQAAAALSVVLSSDGPLMPGGAMTPAQRLTHLGAAIRFGTGPRLLALVAVMIAVLVTGRFPIDAPVPAAVAFWAASALTASAARRALARGSVGWGDGLRQAWRVIGAEVAAVVDVARGRVGPAPLVGEPKAQPSGLRALAHLPLLDLVVMALDVTLLVRAATLFDRDLLPPFPTLQRIAVLGFAVVVLVPIVDVLQVTAVRHQRRNNYRLPAVLEATLNGTPAATVDLTPEGVGILLPVGPAVGSTGSVEISLPGADGVVRRVKGRVAVRSVRPETSDRWRVGLEFLHVAPAARQALVSFCAQLPADEEPDGADAATAVDPAVTAEDRRRRSVRRGTVTAGVAGLATLIFGPGVASASTISPELVERICVTDPDGGPVIGVVVERRLDGSDDLVGTTDLAGCVRIEPSLETLGFTVEREGSRYELTAVDYGGTDVSVGLLTWPVLVVDLDGEPVLDAEVRHFTDRWQPTSQPGEDTDTYRFETWPTDTAERSVEVVIDGVRHVRPVGRPDSDGADRVVVLARIRFDPTDTEAPAIDRGRGWQTVVDGMDLMPGPAVIRLAGGEILRVEVPEGHELVLPAGELVAVTVDVAEPMVDPVTMTEPVATTETTTSPATDTSAESTATTSTTTSTSIATTTTSVLATETSAGPDDSVGVGP